MKIAIVIGLEWHARQLKQGLVQLGHEVIVISTSKISDPDSRIPMNILLRLAEKFPIIKIIVNPIFSYLARKRLNEIECQIVIFWSSYGFSFKKLDAFKILVRGSNHIRTQYALLGRGKKLADKVAIFLEEKDYRLADRITVPSDFIFQDPNWREYMEKMNFAPYGCTPTLENPNTRMVRKNFRGIFIGEFGYRKGADRILKFLETRKILDSFTVLGNNRSGVKKLPKWWNFQGQVSNKQVQKNLIESEVLILLSREEGMARVGLEAITLGVPLIVSSETGLGFWTERGCGVLVSNPDSASEFFNAIEIIKQSQHQFAINCLKASSSWTWVNHADEILKNLPPGI